MYIQRVYKIELCVGTQTTTTTTTSTSTRSTTITINYFQKYQKYF